MAASQDASKAFDSRALEWDPPDVIAVAATCAFRSPRQRWLHIILLLLRLTATEADYIPRPCAFSLALPFVE